MANFTEWILIITSSILFIKSFNRILNYNSKSVADYVMLVIYVFNCLPVLLDNLVGIPKYVSWFYKFKLALENDTVSIIYSLYILASIISLAFYLKRKNRNSVNDVYSHNNSILFNNRILPIIILLPYMHILISGNTSSYFIYGTMSSRGLANNFYQMNTFLVFISIFAFCCLFFSKNRSIKAYLFLLLPYAFSIAWVDGKRYIIVTLIITFLYFYLNSINARMKKIPIKSVFLFIAFGFLIFNFIYALYVKPIATNSFDSMYSSYRIDFGRDDVTKFVLYREIILEEPILEYRGETFISTVFTFVPRDIWPSKPYPHYRYLSAELYDTSIFDIPSGMTPSLYEMSVANLGVTLGMIFTIGILILACLWADNSKSVPRKAIYLLIIIGLLTQSIDSMLGFFVIVLLSGPASLIKRSLRNKNRKKI